MVRSRFLRGQTGASLPHRGAFLERVPDFLKKAVLLVQTGHYEEALILAGPRLFDTRQGVPALLAQVETLRIMCGVERPFHAGGSATGAFHTNASSLGSVGVLGAAKRCMASRMLSALLDVVSRRIPFKSRFISTGEIPASLARAA